MLVMAEEHLEKLKRHGQEDYPLECCGALMGRIVNGRNVVEAVVRCSNVKAEPTRYEIDPRELVNIQREARKHGREIVGFYHSHPDHPCMWSETDLAEAHWIGCSYVIVSVNRGKAAEVKSFRLTGRVEEEKQFVAEEIEVVDGRR